MENIDLLDVLQKYLFFNDLSLRHVAKRAGIPYTTLHGWYSGNRRLSAKNVVKIRDYLNGQYDVEVNQVANYLLRGEGGAN